MIIESVEQMYRDQAKLENQKPRRWNRASSMGRCPRELAYTKLGIQGEPLTPRRMSIFDDGHFYDEKLKNDIAKACPWCVPIPLGSWPSVTIEGVEITGTPDFIILPHGEYGTVGLGEIKSMANFSFERALAGKIDESYACQAWTYASANSLNPIVFFCVQKETRHICEVTFDRNCKETIVTKRYGGDEREITLQDPLLTHQIRSPFNEEIAERVRSTVRGVAACDGLSTLPPGIRVVEPETVKVQGQAKAEELKARYGEPVKSGSWFTLQTGRQVLGFSCNYCSFKQNCFPGVQLEIEGGKPKWVV